MFFSLNLHFGQSGRIEPWRWKLYIWEGKLKFEVLYVSEMGVMDGKCQRQSGIHKWRLLSARFDAITPVAPSQLNDLPTEARKILQSSQDYYKHFAPRPFQTYHSSFPPIFRITLDWKPTFSPGSAAVCNWIYEMATAKLATLIIRVSSLTVSFFNSSITERRRRH